MSFVTYISRASAEQAKRNAEENGAVLCGRFIKVNYTHNTTHFFLM